MHITTLLLLAVLGIHFSFLSSLLNVPFDTANNALTIYRCGSATQYVTTCYHTSSNYSILFIGVVTVFQLVVPVDGVLLVLSVVDSQVTALMSIISCRYKFNW